MKRLRSGWRLALVYALPPLLFGALWVALSLTNDEAAPDVSILDARTVVKTGTRAEALDFAEERAGMRPLLPSVLPRGRHELTEVSAVPERPPGTGYMGVYFRYEDTAAEHSSFWVNQYKPNSIDIPEGLPTVETTVLGARLWTLGEPPPDATGLEQRFQFIAKTARYDRVISFEGAERPDMNRARLVIESMLRQD